MEKFLEDDEVKVEKLVTADEKLSKIRYEFGQQEKQIEELKDTIARRDF